MSPLLLRSLWTGEGPWVWGHAALLTLLLGTLVARVVLQSAVRSPNSRALRALNMAIAPLLVVFLVVVLQRFRGLS
ncbi:hypothetical protein ACQP2P_14760 [Dactylosporangium sp. CA-139114]|uniref:hypothetical protein n=1 Tax=Dactylosporangium sp. CA-139114 TaxID=3239931 RepID=UPI003D97B258